MRAVGAAFEFRVELAANEPRMAGQLDDLHKGAIRGSSRKHQTGLLQLLPEGVIEFVAVAVAFADLPSAVQGKGFGALGNQAGIASQPHGAALLGHAHLLRQQGDNGVGGGAAEFGAVGIRPACRMAGKFNNGDLHPQADAEVGDVLFPGKLRRHNHALDAAVAEAAGHQDAAAAAKRLGDVLRGEGLAVHPADGHLGITGGAGMKQRLRHADVGIPQAGIFAHQGDFHMAVDALYPLHYRRPFGQVGGSLPQPQPPADGIAQARLMQQQRDLIQGVGGHIGDDTVFRDVAEQGDFAADVLADGGIGAADQDIRLDADRQKLLDGMLGGLAF